MLWPHQNASESLLDGRVKIKQLTHFTKRPSHVCNVQVIKLVDDVRKESWQSAPRNIKETENARTTMDNTRHIVGFTAG